MKEIEELERLLNQLDMLVISDLGCNPYEDLEKAIKIVEQRNIKQFSSLEKKMKNFCISITNRRLKSAGKIYILLDKIYELLKT
ncbi:hypothetical protein [Labilibaculum euxinus]